MDKQQIIDLFHEVINRKDAIKVTGLTRYVLYNYRKREKEPSLGTMLEVLLNAGEIAILKK